MSFFSDVGKAFKKITFKGTVKAVEKVAAVAVPLVVAGPAGGLLGGLVGAAVSGKPRASDPTPPEAYGLAALSSSSSSPAGGIFGAVKNLGSELIDAAKRLGSAEADRVKSATTGAINAAVQDVLNIATGVKKGSQAAAGAVRNAPPTEPAATGAMLWVVVAIVVAVLFIARGRK